MISIFHFECFDFRIENSIFRFESSIILFGCFILFGRFISRVEAICRPLVSAYDHLILPVLEWVKRWSHFHFRRTQIPLLNHVVREEGLSSQNNDGSILVCPFKIFKTSIRSPLLSSSFISPSLVLLSSELRCFSPCTRAVRMPNFFSNSEDDPLAWEWLPRLNGTT